MEDPWVLYVMQMALGLSPSEPVDRHTLCATLTHLMRTMGLLRGPETETKPDVQSQTAWL